jgi:hypothetical protein
MADTTQTPIAKTPGETGEEKTDQAMDMFLENAGE